MRLKWVVLVISLLLLSTMVFTSVLPVTGAPDDTVRVWVTYQNGRKAEVFQTLEKANASLQYDFPQLDAYVVSLPKAALNGILHNPFVIEVEGDPERYPVEPILIELDEPYEDLNRFADEVIPWGVEAVQARDIWDPNDNGEAEDALYKGEGIKVCIIDTGYYTGHEDLKDESVTGMSQVDDDWSRDGGAHGSHVAGTIAALNNGLGVVGVTPGAVDLHIVKIFDDSGAWVSKAHASDLTAAIYDCQENGANIISMSLSGTMANTKEERAFNELYDAGILHIAAASNDHVEGAEIDPYHYPASYASVVSVAAVDSNLEVADFSQRNDKVELAAPGVGVLSTIPYIDETLLTVDGEIYQGYLVEYASRTPTSGILVDGSTCEVGGDWEGMVVLCQRGNNTFYEKTMNVQSSGGVAAVIYNNVYDDTFFTLGEGNSSEIIAIQIGKDLGEFLVSEKLGFTANITSSYEFPASGYEAWGGTSMATPHVSGVAALIWSANPDWSNVQIREAMVSTAADLGDPGCDVAYGWGFVQAADALAELEGNNPPPQEDQLFVEITNPEHAAQFTDKDTVVISIVVTDGSLPVQGADVAVTIEGTQFKPQIYQGITDAEGMVSFNYRIISRKTGNGQYNIDVVATLEGYLSGTASTMFTVQ